MKKVYQTLEQKLFYTGEERYTEKEEKEPKLKIKLKPKQKGVNKNPMKEVEPSRVEVNTPINVMVDFNDDSFKQLMINAERVANESMVSDRFEEVYKGFGLILKKGRVMLDDYALYNALKDDTLLAYILSPVFYDDTINTVAPKFKFDTKAKNDVTYNLTERVMETFRYFQKIKQPGMTGITIGGKFFNVDSNIVMFVKALLVSHVNANKEFSTAVYKFALSIIKMITIGKLTCPAIDSTVETSLIKKKVYEELNTQWALILKDTGSKYSKVLTQEQKNARKAKMAANKKAKEAAKKGSVLEAVIREAEEKDD